MKLIATKYNVEWTPKYLNVPNFTEQGTKAHFINNILFDEDYEFIKAQTPNTNPSRYNLQTLEVNIDVPYDWDFERAMGTNYLIMIDDNGKETFWFANPQTINSGALHLKLTMDIWLTYWDTFIIQNNNFQVLQSHYNRLIKDEDKLKLDFNGDNYNLNILGEFNGEKEVVRTQKILSKPLVNNALAVNEIFANSLYEVAFVADQGTNSGFKGSVRTRDGNYIDKLNTLYVEMKADANVNGYGYINGNLIRKIRFNFSGSSGNDYIDWDTALDAQSSNATKLYKEWFENVATQSIKVVKGDLERFILTDNYVVEIIDGVWTINFTLDKREDNDGDDIWMVNKLIWKEEWPSMALNIDYKEDQQYISTVEEDTVNTREWNHSANLHLEEKDINKELALYKTPFNEMEITMENKEPFPLDIWRFGNIKPSFLKYNSLDDEVTRMSLTPYSGEYLEKKMWLDGIHSSYDEQLELPIGTSAWTENIGLRKNSMIAGMVGAVGKVAFSAIGLGAGGKTSVIAASITGQGIFNSYSKFAQLADLKDRSVRDEKSNSSTLHNLLGLNTQSLDFYLVEKKMKNKSLIPIYWIHYISGVPINAIQKIERFDTRYYFNYWMINDFMNSFERRELPQPIVSQFNRIFETGVRLWHYRGDGYNDNQFDLENIETDIIDV